MRCSLSTPGCWNQRWRSPPSLPSTEFAALKHSGQLRTCDTASCPTASTAVAVEAQAVDDIRRKDWHLHLIPGQYRGARGTKAFARPVKLVHNIVLSMPAPTPPEKVLAAAKVFAREKFGATHRYAMALHTHQEHPHVHLVVRAEREDGRGRLHIDKAMLREWREDFVMRDQGIAANATSRAARGQTKGATRDAIYRTRGRGSSYALREEVQDIAKELSRTGTIRDPAHGRLEETRKGVVTGWMNVAATLDAQGEICLAGDVRWFAKNLPPVLTDRERLAAQFMRYVSAGVSARTQEADKVRNRELERTR